MTLTPEITRELEDVANRFVLFLKDRIWVPRVTEMARSYGVPNTTRVYEWSTAQWYDVDLSEASERVKLGEYNAALYQMIQAALTPRSLSQQETKGADAK